MSIGNKGGRPRTVGADYVMQLRIDKATDRRIDFLSGNWECSRSEVVRRAVLDSMDKNGFKLEIEP